MTLWVGVSKGKGKGKGTLHHRPLSSENIYHPYTTPTTQVAFLDSHGPLKRGTEWRRRKRDLDFDFFPSFFSVICPSRSHGCCGRPAFVYKPKLRHFGVQEPLKNGVTKKSRLKKVGRRTSVKRGRRRGEGVGGGWEVCPASWVGGWVGELCIHCYIDRGGGSGWNELLWVVGVWVGGWGDGGGRRVGGWVGGWVTFWKWRASSGSCVSRSSERRERRGRRGEGKEERKPVLFMGG